jgi:hypothetical protein
VCLRVSQCVFMQVCMRAYARVRLWICAYLCFCVFMYLTSLAPLVDHAAVASKFTELRVGHLGGA